MKRTIITVAVAVFLFLAVSIGIAIYSTPPHVSGDLPMAYKRMVKEHVLAQWECAPASDREKLMLSLIDRFSPEDAELIKQGRIWKDELKAKEEAGTLTVAERDQLYSGYYYDTQDEFQQSIKVRTGNFSKPICGDTGCQSPFMSVTEERLVYEDEYSRWALDGDSWGKAILQEFKGLSKRDVAYSVSRHQKMEAERRKKARDAVLSLPSLHVPEGEVQQKIEDEYYEILCSNGQFSDL